MDNVSIADVTQSMVPKLPYKSSYTKDVYVTLFTHRFRDSDKNNFAYEVTNCGATILKGFTEFMVKTVTIVLQADH